MMRSLFAIVLLSVGCGGSAVKEKSLPPIPDRAELLQGASLGPGDVVEIRIYKEEQLTGLYRVDADGTFSFPLVGVVRAAGLNAGELTRQLTAALRTGYLRDPQVSVFVKEFNSKKVFVLGQVKKPGTFKYEDKMSIVQAVTLAGGLMPLAAGNRVVLTRVIAGEEEKFILPFDGIGRGEAENVLLQPGDIVFVPETWL